MRQTFIAISLLLSYVLHAQNGSDSKPKLVHFTPTSFYHKFSANTTPVLTIHPGDTVSTETIDAMGFDKNGIKRERGGNPLTGPFYIEGTMPGDVLVIELHDVSLNRAYAHTTEYFSSRSMPSEIAKQFKKSNLVRWKFDMDKNLAWPDSTLDTYHHLKNFRIPLAPFLGCIGVAPSNKKNEILSFFQGPYGGNMDYKSIATGATVYLPVFHTGAYFYVGDGHAIQGDGEIAGNALETSMNVTFSVQLIKKELLQLTFPRVEDATYIMATGVDKNMNDALKVASFNLLEWLQKDYQLTLHEATQVMSTCIEYTVAEIADPEIVIVAKIKKELLKGLQKQ
jgi:acetamidase/formamidase